MSSNRAKLSRRVGGAITVVTGLALAGIFLLPRAGRSTANKVTYLNQTIFYDRAGTGSVVILVPGLWRGHTEFDQVKAILTSTHDVISWDLLGQADSSCPDINYDANTQVEMLGALMSSLNVPKAHLVGFGEGATIAARFATQNPSKVQSLALLSAMDVEYLDSFSNPISVNTAKIGQPGWAYRRYFPPTALTEAKKALSLVLASSPNSPMVTDANAKAAYLLNLKGGCFLGGRIQDKNRINSWFTKAEGAQLVTAKVPTTLLWGDADQVLNSGFQDAWSAAISSATKVTIKNGATPPTCGHDFINECPASTATALNSFFAANGG